VETSKLSSYYYLACDRIHQIVDDLYEAIHDESGLPLDTSEEVEEALKDVKSFIWHEIDLIKSAVDEFEGK
tara:strand:+ start:1065 stop:1277 length:213 start_codon:yes stop_codon:yes gene_type:complete